MQVRWSGGQLGCGQPDSSLKDFNANIDFDEKVAMMAIMPTMISVKKVAMMAMVRTPSILAVDCAIAPQRARNTTLVTSPLI